MYDHELRPMNFSEFGACEVNGRCMRGHKVHNCEHYDTMELIDLSPSAGFHWECHLGGLPGCAGRSALLHAQLQPHGQACPALEGTSPALMHCWSFCPAMHKSLVKDIMDIASGHAAIDDNTKNRYLCNVSTVVEQEGG